MKEDEERKKTKNKKQRYLNIKHEMKGGVPIPKQRGLFQMCFPNFRAGRLGEAEEAKLQKEPKIGQKEEVAFRKTLPHPVQQNLACLPLVHTTSHGNITNSGGVNGRRRPRSCTHRLEPKRPR